MRSRGFNHISSHDSYSNGFVTSYWWHGGNKNCVAVEASRGEVMTVNDAKGSDCGYSNDGNVAAAVGIVAGAAILGALLSHKSHHSEDKNYNQSQTGDFERGYNDGLYGGTYHNYSRSDAYSHGYERGNDERLGNLRGSGGRGGYAAYAQFDDLRDARAAGGMSELERRGFRQVDNFTSGNTRYSIQWRPQSRQCVQVTIADGRFYDVRDIGQHPRCR